MEEYNPRHQFEGALEEWRESELAADAEEARYRRSPTEQGKEASDRLIRSWQAIASARRQLANLYGASAQEAMRLNTELDRRIATLGPEAKEVADFLADIQGKTAPPPKAKG